MSVVAGAAGPALLPRERRARLVRVGIYAFFALAVFVSVSTGASGTSAWATLGQWLRGEEMAVADRVVLFDIRLPRLALGILVGASLAVAGAVMQGLFRNPLADPGLVGVSAGAGLGAVVTIVLGGLLPVALRDMIGTWLVPLAAFGGGLVTTILLYSVATRSGRTSIATMLLAGIAIAALAGAVIGVMVYIADDRQLRDLTFWGLGSLAGATWTKVAAAAPVIILALAASPFLARGLNALALGEAAASHMGVPVQRLKSAAIITVAAATGASVAVSGGIGFIGIVVPHLLRLVNGPDHRSLLPDAAVLGAAVLLLADAVSRTIVAPAEMPIGVITAVLGAPVFLWVLLRQRGLVDL
jgi:iron complex transport system permease protein